ncbi:MAG: 50S ribosomal protein L22 [candidate division Zixibacteria bacterium]|nr:50S ribosomal protein L22 [candidate division Zixibacteria bacterium]
MTQEVQSPVKDRILAQIKAMEESDRQKVIKTSARRVKVRPEYVGHTLAVFNGEEYKKVRITGEMKGRTLGQVVPRLTPTAQIKFVSIPQKKMRLVADLVIGLPVEQAINILTFTPKIAAKHMVRTLKSAIANKLSIEGTAALNPEDLYVRRIVVSAGPTAKRIRFQSMGRVFRYKKRFCHLAIYLGERTPKVETVVSETTGKKTVKKAGGTRTAGKKATTAKKKTARKTTAAKKKAAPKTQAKATKKAAPKARTEAKKATTTDTQKDAE